MSICCGDINLDKTLETEPNTKNIFFDRIYTDLYGEYLMGKITYKGFHEKDLASASYKISNNLANLDAKLGLVLIDTQSLQVIPYGGLGFRYWKRHTMKEYTYYNFKPIIGIRTGILTEQTIFSV